MTNQETLNITVNERSVTLGAPGLRVLCDAAERVQEGKTRRFTESLEGCRSLTGEALAAALSNAVERHQSFVTDCEVAEWLDSPEGDAFLFWHAARIVSPDLSEDEARTLHESLSSDQVSTIAAFFAARLGRSLKTSVQGEFRPPMLTAVVAGLPTEPHERELRSQSQGQEASNAAKVRSETIVGTAHPA
ncbi:MAG: hypothetical protein AB7O26_02720 [Planctomycetaceae bacterium]